MKLKLRIMCRAVRTRMGNGEELEIILASYPRLSETEKAEIRKIVL